MSRLVHVKWSKEKYDVSLPAEAGGASLKHELEKLTGVPVARQKLMAKGAWVGVLKDETTLTKLKPEQTVTLMGSAEVVVPKAQPRFVEDMPEAEQAATGRFLPAGLENLGNTCYLNSTLQCLRAVPELRGKLEAYGRGARVGPLGMSGAPDVTAALGLSYATLDASTKAIAPLALVAAVREAFPQFAQRGQRGGFAQQDAEELYSTLLAELAARLKETPAADTRSSSTGASAADVNAVDALFGVELEETLRCAESDAEPAVTRPSDKARKLVCNIQGGHGNTTKVNHLHEGLKLGLEGTLEKRSDVLDRNAVWSKTQRIAKLPPYLCVQFMRFFWKATPDNDDHEGVKCKIVRPVSFPDTLDVFDYGTDALKAKLKFNRDKYGAKLDVVVDKSSKNADDDDKPKADDAAAPTTETTTPETKEAPAAMEVDEDEVDDELAAAIAMSKGDAALDAPPDFEKDGLPADFTGEYEIFALVTHKGRSADGGHYIGWVRTDRGADKWLVFDDDLVSESSTEYVISQLKGGGDEHMAYLAFYRAKGAADKHKLPADKAKAAAAAK